MSLLHSQEMGRDDESQELQMEEGSKLLSKIEGMKQEVTLLSVQSRGKSLESLCQLEQEQEKASSFVEQQQRRLLYQVNSLQQTLLQIERQRMMKSASIGNSQQAVEQQLMQAEEDIRGTFKQSNASFHRLRDEVMNLKVRLAEVEGGCREKGRKFERELQVRVASSSKEVEELGKGGGRREKQLGEARSLRKAVEEEGRRQQRESSRLSSLVAELSLSVGSRLAEEERRQKEGFQQNYSALQELFLFLSQQYGVQT